MAGAWGALLVIVAAISLWIYVLAGLSAITDLTQPGPSRPTPAGQYEQGGRPWTPRP